MLVLVCQASLVPRESDALQTVLHDVSQLLQSVLGAQQALMSQPDAATQPLQRFCNALESVHEEFKSKMKKALQATGGGEMDPELERDLAQVSRTRNWLSVLQVNETFFFFCLQSDEIYVQTNMNFSVVVLKSRPVTFQPYPPPEAERGRVAIVMFSLVHLRHRLKIDGASIPGPNHDWCCMQATGFHFVKIWPFVLLQYCRVPKNGLPKNGQAGISSKKKNDPGWKNELRTVSPHVNSVSCEDAFFGGIADFETTPLRRRASSHTVCALQANLCDSKTDRKLRTRLAGVVKNKNDPGWDRLPPVLRHPTVL